MVPVSPGRRPYWRIAPGLVAVLAVMLVAGLPATPARSQDLGALRLRAPQDAAPLVDSARIVSQACVFGAAAGAFGTLVFGAPLVASGVGAPGIATITLGAAAAGCILGFVGAGAATAFGFVWERNVAPQLEDPPGGKPQLRPGRARPEQQAGSAGEAPLAPIVVRHRAASPL